MLFNIDTLEWDAELLEKFKIPAAILPQVVESSEVVGHTKLLGHSIPIAGIAGDQQSALFGQRCFKPGLSKNTYGTGCFMLLNTGTTRRHSENQLLSTVAWTVNGETQYALEGSVFIGGAAVGWLRDGLGIIESSAQVEELARSVEDNGGVYFVPAFNGLGTPHWDQDARGLIIGLTRGSNRGHVARATLESIAFQVADLMEAMKKDSGLELKELRVDGGAAANNLLLQFQSDLLRTAVVRPKNTETTAMGAALLAGLAVGFFKNLEEVSQVGTTDRVFTPEMSEEDASTLTNQWQRAVSRSKAWTES
jgi:glycerol kinase